MATLEHLRGDGTLVRYDAELEPGEMPQRMIYMAVAFVDWAEDVLFGELADEDQPLSPYEQVEARFYDFVVNRPMVYGVHKKLLRPEIRGVWTLRTDDVRVRMVSGKGNLRCRLRRDEAKPSGNRGLRRPYRACSRIPRHTATRRTKEHCRDPTR